MAMAWPSNSIDFIRFELESNHNISIKFQRIQIMGRETTSLHLSRNFPLFFPKKYPSCIANSSIWLRSHPFPHFFAHFHIIFVA